MTPQSSSSSPLRPAWARIEASTARQCRRSARDSTHSQSRDQASSREIRDDMTVTLAKRPAQAALANPVMEKFVIDGGVPLSGTVVPAGNKNAALPILAACRAHRRRGRRAQRPADPRRRGDARAARRTSACASSGAGTTRSRCAPPTSTTDAHVDRELAERIRASFLLAGPLLARFGRADMPPPGRRRDRAPAPGPAPRRVPRAWAPSFEHDARHRDHGAAAACAPATSSWTSRR